MKKKLLAAALIAILLSLLGYGSMAYFTADGMAHNVITTGELDIGLLEWSDSGKNKPFPTGGVTGVMPGSRITKIAEITNSGTSEAWIRMSVEKRITLDPSRTGTPDLNVLSLDLDLVNWTLGSDGYYYYNQKLKPGQTTPPLFTTVSFDISMGDMYQNCTVDVILRAYAVQTANNGTDVMSAQGWPAP